MQRFIARNLVLISVAFAGLMALALGLMLAWQSFAAHRDAQQLQSVQTITASLFETGGLLARERGYTAVILNSLDHPDHVIEIALLRKQVDESWSEAEEALWRLVDNLPEQLDQRARVEAFQVARGVLLEARERMDLALQSGHPHPLDEAHVWFDTISDVIATLANLRGRLQWSLDMPVRFSWVNMSWQNSLWWSSEASGQRRGSLRFMPPLASLCMGIG